MTRLVDEGAVDREGLRRGFLGRVPPAFAQWRDPAVIEREWDEEFGVQLGRCTDMGHAKSFAGLIGRGAPADYLQRVIDVDGAQVLCGVRFLGGDAAQPFVDVIAWTGACPPLARVAEAVVGAYGVFDVRCARVFDAGTGAPSVGDGWRVRGDQAVCGAPLGVVAQSDAGRGSASVELEDAQPDEADAFVREAYAAFRARSVELAERVPPTDLEGLAECEGKGRLSWWLIDGARAGLIAVSRETWFGLDGYLVMEEVVSGAHLGRGSAALAQRALARELALESPDLTLFGTIDCANEASLRTAARVGRAAVATWWFIERE